VGALLALEGAGALQEFDRHVGTLQSAVNTIGVALFFLMGFRTNSRCAAAEGVGAAGWLLAAASSGAGAEALGGGAH
jgi:hypothetical protein